MPGTALGPHFLRTAETHEASPPYVIPVVRRNDRFPSDGKAETETKKSDESLLGLFYILL